MSNKKLNAQKVFGKNLKVFIQEGGFNQRVFAENAGMSESNLSRIIGGTSAPSFEFLSLLESEYNASLDWLFSGVGNRLRPSPEEIAESEMLDKQILMLVKGRTKHKLIIEGKDRVYISKLDDLIGAMSPEVIDDLYERFRTQSLL